MTRRDEDVCGGRERRQSGFTIGACFADRAQDGENQRVGFPHHDGVGEGREGQRVREGEWTAGEDQRVVRPTVGAKRRDSGGFEQADDAGELELVGDR